MAQTRIPASRQPDLTGPARSRVLASGPNRRVRGPFALLMRPVGTHQQPLAVPAGIVSLATLLNFGAPGSANAASTTVDSASGDPDQTQISPLVTPGEHAGPFRAGMATSFHNIETLTGDMAAAMNTVYDRLRSHQFSRDAAIAWTLHGVHESFGGTIFSQQSGGDGAGFFQLSGWRGGGAGAATARLGKPGTGRKWQRTDFIRGQLKDPAADRERILLNSADALVQLLWENGDDKYHRLLAASQSGGDSVAEIARRSTRDFVRPGAVTYQRRTQQIIGTFTQNQQDLLANADAFERARQARRPLLSPHGEPISAAAARARQETASALAAEVKAKRHRRHQRPRQQFPDRPPRIIDELF